VKAALFAKQIINGLVLQTLVNKVGELKIQLAAERTGKLAMEAEVRKELCDYFSNMMVEAQAVWE
jgi:hypothetical protein